MVKKRENVGQGDDGVEVWGVLGELRWSTSGLFTI